jgi:hypothetical protein
MSALLSPFAGLLALNDPRRDTHGGRPGRNVLEHEAHCTDARPIPDGDVAEYLGVSADLHVVADARYWAARLHIANGYSVTK